MNREFCDALELVSRRHLSDEAKRRHLDVLGQLNAARMRRRRRRRVATIVVSGAMVLSAAGVGTAAALGAFAQAPTDRLVAHCYANLKLDDPGNHNDILIVGKLVAGHESSDLLDVSASAIDICGDQWREGQLHTTEPVVRPPEFASNPVPDLVACVLPSGQVGVFPGLPSVCGTLGLLLALP